MNVTKNYQITHEDEQFIVLTPLNKKTGKLRTTGKMVKNKLTGEVFHY